MNKLKDTCVDRIILRFRSSMSSSMERIERTDKNGRTRFVDIAVYASSDGTARIVKSTGIVGGKTGVSETVVHSGYEKALLRAQTMWNNEHSKAHMVLPMLANKWEDKKKYITEPFYVQPKIDGVRLLVSASGCFSRTGKPVLGLEHLSTGLREGEFLDGECYDPSKSFEEITSLFKTSPETLEFHVFDYFDTCRPTLSFEERKKRVTVETILVAKKADIPKYHDQFVAAGHEGIMIRNKNSPYEIGKRSNYLLKLKYFQTEEYEIVGAKEATGREKGTAIWECITGEHVFHVKPEGSLEHRRSLWRERGKYVGKYLTVRFQNLTEMGLPRFPVGVTVRDYE